MDYQLELLVPWHGRHDPGHWDIIDPKISVGPRGTITTPTLVEGSSEAAARSRAFRR